MNHRGYCPIHQQYAPKKEAFQNAKRANEDLYHSAKWRKLRKETIEKYGSICRFCGKKTDNPQIHHIIPPRGNETLFFDPENLAVICPDCHRKITEQEIENRKQNH